MPPRHPLPTRRAMLGVAVAAVAARPRPGVAAVQQGLAVARGLVDPVLLARTSDALARHAAQIWSRDVIAIADFGLPSSVPRLHLVDILRGRVTSLLVAHGKGSDPDHSGMLQSFSDAEGSLATSEGAYLTGATYIGAHGFSRRLTGLDPTDANAWARAIVIHGAWYADPALIARQGKLGRSDGCFAVAPGAIVRLLTTLGEGRLLYAGKAQ